MSTPLEQDPNEGKLVYFRSGRQQELAEYLESSCSRLMDSGIFYDDDGTIYYHTWRDLPEDGVLPPDYVIISDLHPQADIYAPHTRYTRWREQLIFRIAKDDGSVEAAIRSVDHALTGTRGKQSQQMQAVRRRADEMLTLFAGSFSDLTQEDLNDARADTYRLLRQVDLNPGTVYSQQKRKIAHWLPKGSFGKDATGRRNKLIAACALTAANHQAIIRQRGLKETETKFITMRLALVIEREYSRALFADVAEKIRPEAMPASIAFRQPDRRLTEGETGTIVGMIGTMVFQLEQPRLKTYRTVGREAADLLTLAQELVKTGNRRVVTERNLLERAYTLLTDELTLRADIYPDTQPQEPDEPDEPDTDMPFATP